MTAGAAQGSRARRVWVFFYGSFIDRDVLAESGLTPIDVRVAHLTGYDIRIAPLANLTPSPGDTVYGIVCRATHAELEQLYGQAWVGAYRPEAVLVETAEGDRLPALCYIAPPGAERPADGAYIDRIVEPGRAYGFPEWYLARVNAFRR